MRFESVHQQGLLSCVFKCDDLVVTHESELTCQADYVAYRSGAKRNPHGDYSSGLDLKNYSVHLHGMDAREYVLSQRNILRGYCLQELQRHVPPGSQTRIKAFAETPFWARHIQACGYRVNWIAPQFVKPFVKSNRNNAAAICEAMNRPWMGFLALKRPEQEDVQAVHRVRAEQVKQRMAKANQIRALVDEYGLVARLQIGQLRRVLLKRLKDRTGC